MGEQNKILTEAIQAVVMAIGRERNAIEFYSYLAETAPALKAREFFKTLSQRETCDMADLESVLSKLKKEDEGV